MDGDRCIWCLRISIRGVEAGFEPDPWSDWTSQTSVARTVTDYDSQQGGGSFKFEGYDVRVRDCADNVTQKFVSFRPGVFQEGGRSYGYFGVTSSYTGTWGVSTCTCWSGGSARRTSAKGARANFTFDYTGPHPVALVMEKAPNRGRAQIYVDGVLRATIDTYSATVKHRSVVWIGTLKTAGRHTVSVVNMATPGRSRIDVDAVMVSGLSA